MYKKIARIGPISCGVFFALMSLLFYLVTAGYAFATKNHELFNGLNAPANPILKRFEMSTNGAMDPTSINLIDLVYGGAYILVAGLILGLLVAILYNIVAMITGGIKIKTHDLGYDDI